MANKTEELLELLQVAVEASKGHLRIAYKEEDTSRDEDLESAHFLKLNGVRFGRDIEIYNFMGISVGWPFALSSMMSEILLEIKRQVPSSYEALKEPFRKFGEAQMPPELVEKWNELF